MESTLFGKLKGVFFAPSETFDKVIRHDEAKDIAIYLLVLVVIFSVMFAILLTLGVGMYAGALTGIVAGGFSLIAVIPILFFVLLIGVVIWTVWVHLWVYLLGGRKDITETAKTVVYAATPSLLLGWVPVIGVLMGIWTLILAVIGIHELHEISITRAALVVLLAWFIPVLLGAAAFGSFLAMALVGGA